MTAQGQAGGAPYLHGMTDRRTDHPGAIQHRAVPVVLIVLVLVALAVAAVHIDATRRAGWCRSHVAAARYQDCMNGTLDD